MALVFRASTEAGSPSAQANLVINVPAGVVDDDHLVLFGVTADGDDGGFDALSGWTEIRDAAVFLTGGSAPSPPGMSVWTRRASSEPSSYTITPTFGNTGIAAKMIAFSGGHLSAILDVTETIATGDSTNANPPTNNSGSGTDGFAVIVAAFWDSAGGDFTAVPTGYTDPNGLGDIVGSGGGNGCSLAIAYRTSNVDPAAAEDPAVFTSSAEQWGAITISLRPAPEEGITDVVPDEFDMDAADVDIEGLAFGATIGASDVYLSPNDLLSEAGEVDITAAVNTWSDTLINLDLTLLSQAVLNSLHAMGPGARFVIVNVGGVPGTTEFFFPITLHRPQAFQMVLGAIVPGTTTSRLTGMSGTFGGGRAEETAAQNPSTTLTNVADNGNREDVASLEAKPLARPVQYDFQLAFAGVAPDTLTQTPQVTVLDRPPPDGTRVRVLSQSVNRAGNY